MADKPSCTRTMSQPCPMRYSTLSIYPPSVSQDVIQEPIVQRLTLTKTMKMGINQHLLWTRCSSSGPFAVQIHVVFRTFHRVRQGCVRLSNQLESIFAPALNPTTVSGPKSSKANNFSPYLGDASDFPSGRLS